MEELGVVSELLLEQIYLLFTQVDQPAILHPVSVFQSCGGAGLYTTFAARSTVQRAFQVVTDVDVLLSIEDVGHDDEVDSLDASGARELNLVQTVEARD